MTAFTSMRQQQPFVSDRLANIHNLSVDTLVNMFFLGCDPNALAPASNDYGTLLHLVVGALFDRGFTNIERTIELVECILKHKGNPMIADSNHLLPVTSVSKRFSVDDERSREDTDAVDRLCNLLSPPSFAYVLSRREDECSYFNAFPIDMLAIILSYMHNHPVSPRSLVRHVCFMKKQEAKIRAIWTFIRGFMDDV